MVKRHIAQIEKDKKRFTNYYNKKTKKLKKIAIYIILSIY